MAEHEKIPAQGGEMPPVERAADTGGRGINTVRGATSAGNAAQDRNTNAAALTDDFRGNDANLVRSIEALIALNDEGALVPHGIGGLARVLLSAAAVRLTSPRAAVPAPKGWKLVPIEPTEDMIVDGFESWPDQFFSKPEVWASFEKMSGCARAAHKAKLCYSAMLDAAPAAPVADEWDASQQAYIESLDEPAQAVAADGAATGIDTKAIAESLERMIVDWYADCERTRLDWKQMAGVIKLRLDRFLKRAAVSPATAETSTGMPDEVRESLMDSQYLAGVTAGWNAANADDPNAALEKIHASRAGYLRPLRDWQKAGRPGVPATPATADERAAQMRDVFKRHAPVWINKYPDVCSQIADELFAIASQAAAPAEAREPIYQCRLIKTPAWIDASRTEFEACATNPALFETRTLYHVPADTGEPFQSRIQPWMLECFGPTIAADRVERNQRFLEEALELVQALGCTAGEAHQLVDYTFGRPVGEPCQEVGGVMVTLAALCLANTLDMHAAGETELARISAPAMVEKIRAKQATKPKHSPLPEAPADAGEAVASVDETTFKHLFYKHGGPVDSEGWCINESGLRDFLADLAAVQGAQAGKGGEA
ncbi:hypothetical protein ACS0Y6_11490 [Burkholderia gladioli]|uniref:hypothetical protein n=1 Tax=Burkholderia gladioli TaxID=28095 RepID=UPI003F79A4A7